MKRLSFAFFLIGIVMLFLSSCEKNRIFDDYKPIPRNGWEKDSPVTFDFNIESTGQKHNLYLNVRNRTSYSYRNIWLFIEIAEPDGAMKKDTVEITLAYPNGKWLGEGFGELKTHTSMYRSNVMFGNTGVHTVEIRHGMRENSLKGISNIGFTVEKTE